MGNCFGKQSSAANFSGEGRTLGAARAHAPAGKRNITRARAPNARVADDAASPGAAAARAAEERLKARKAKGKLGRQLEAQKAQTQAATLAQAARDNVAARDADAATQARNYN